MERLRAQELEASLDRLCIAANRKAADIDRQRQEFEGARAAHAALQTMHAEAVVRQQQLSTRISKLDKELSAEQRLAAGLRQGLADKERQVAVLTAEVERLHGRPVPDTGEGDGAAAAGGSMNAAAVIDTRLVTFVSLSQLVEKNSQLLAVARSLADDLDASRQGIEAKYAEMRAAEAADTERRIAELTDMCNALATEAQACKKLADEALRDRQARDQGSPHGRQTGGASAAELEAARGRIAELETAVSQLRSDSAETSSLLNQQLEAARAGESRARRDAAAAKAQQAVLSNAVTVLQQQVADSQTRAERMAGQLSEYRALVERLEDQVTEVRARKLCTRGASCSV